MIGKYTHEHIHILRSYVLCRDLTSNELSDVDFLDQLVLSTFVLIGENPDIIGEITLAPGTRIQSITMNGQTGVVSILQQVINSKSVTSIGLPGISIVMTDVALDHVRLSGTPSTLLLSVQQIGVAFKIEGTISFIDTLVLNVTDDVTFAGTSVSTIECISNDLVHIKASGIQLPGALIVAGSLAALQSIEVSDNELTQITTTSTSVPVLDLLDVRSNQIADLTMLSNLPSFTQVFAQGNALPAFASIATGTHVAGLKIDSGTMLILAGSDITLPILDIELAGNPAPSKVSVGLTLTDESVSVGVSIVGTGVTLTCSCTISAAKLLEPMHRLTTVTVNGKIMTFNIDNTGASDVFQTFELVFSSAKNVHIYGSLPSTITMKVTATDTLQSLSFQMQNIEGSASSSKLSAPLISTFNITGTEIDSVLLSGISLSGVITISGSMPKLTFLDMSDNVITDLTVSGAEAMETLFLRNNAITDVNVASELAGTLLSLDLVNNDLSGTQTLGSTWLSLTTLTVSDNQIAVFVLVNAANNLASFDISENLIGSVAFASNMPNIRVLDVSSNRFTSTPTMPSALSGLHELNMGHNTLVSLTFGEPYASLRILNLDSTTLSEFDFLLQTSSLVEFSFRSNALSGVVTLPSTQLTALEKLYMNNNDMTELQLTAIMSNLKSVDLSGNSLTTIALKFWPNLETLDLTNNALEGLFHIADPMASLQQLHLGGNDITKLTVSTGLAALADLNLASNKLVGDISEALAITSLSALQVLDVSSNLLTNFATGASVPADEMAFYEQLSSLNLQSNRIMGNLPVFLSFSVTPASIQLDKNSIWCPSAGVSTMTCTRCIDSPIHCVQVCPL
jgi:Leucine-rich repeat (LRR) protein